MQMKSIHFCNSITISVVRNSEKKSTAENDGRKKLYLQAEAGDIHSNQKVIRSGWAMGNREQAVPDSSSIDGQRLEREPGKGIYPEQP